jgi:phosphate-selective porin OprO/OprP
MRPGSGGRSRRASRGAVAWRIPAAFWAGAGLLLAAPVLAGDPEPSDPQPVAEQKARDIEEALDDELSEWEEAVEEELPPGLPPYPRLLHPEKWSVWWSNGLRIEREDGRHKLLLAARILLDGAVFHGDADLRNASGAGWDTGGEVRQARISAQGILFRRFPFKAEYEFSGTESEFKDLFVGINRLGPFDVVQFGFFKEPFSLEQQTSRKYLTFMERSLANALAPSRNTGLMAASSHLDGRLRWAAGVFFVEESFQESDALSSGFDGDWDLSFRLTGLPIYADEGRRLVEVGLSYNHRFQKEGSVGFSSRPESNLLDSLIDTGDIPSVDQGDTLGAELVWEEGPLSIQGEALYTRLGRTDGFSNLGLWGAYLQVSYFLTGEQRVYGRNAGVFGRVVPDDNYKPFKGHWGAFQIAGRISHANLDDGPVHGGRETNSTLGFNWYLRPNLRITVNYVLGYVHGQGYVNVAQARFQLEL